MNEDSFVEDHRDEIEKMAYTIYQMRCQYRQEDNPSQNFTRAITIIKERYAIKAKERKNA